MPGISAFYGIVITMYWRDHPPPHFHATYAVTSRRSRSPRAMSSTAGCRRAPCASLSSGWNYIATSWPPTGIALARTSSSWQSTRFPSIRAVVAVTHVEPLEPYRLRLQFADDSERVVALAAVLWGPMAEPLRDPEYFRRVRVDPELPPHASPDRFTLDPDLLQRDYQEAVPPGPAGRS